MASIYTLPSGMLQSLVLTFASQDVLFGAATSFNITAPNRQVVFPYATTGTTYNTATSTRPEVGIITFAGVLAGTASTLKTAWFDKLGDTQGSVVLLLQEHDTVSDQYNTLLNKTLYDVRVSQAALSAQMKGNYLLVYGEFGLTFRKMVNVGS